MYIRRDQISHIQSMVAKKTGLTNRANYVKKLFKSQHGRIPIDPAILVPIGHHFLAKKENNNKNADARGDQNPEPFLGAL